MPQQERSRALVETILEAAARVLVTRGVDFSTNLVSEAAGVSVGSVYQYFPNKDALCAALIERQAARERTFIIEHMRRAQPTSVRAALEGVWRLRSPFGVVTGRCSNAYCNFWIAFRSTPRWVLLRPKRCRSSRTFWRP